MITIWEELPYIELKQTCWWLIINFWSWRSISAAWVTSLYKRLDKIKVAISQATDRTKRTYQDRSTVIIQASNVCGSSCKLGRKFVCYKIACKEQRSILVIDMTICTWRKFDKSAPDVWNQSWFKALFFTDVDFLPPVQSCLQQSRCSADIIPSRFQVTLHAIFVTKLSLPMRDGRGKTSSEEKWLLKSNKSGLITEL
jgi:hypothetical protein